MKSHAYVERIEDGIVVLELRLTPTYYIPKNEGEPKRRFRYPRKMVHMTVAEVTNVIPNVKERDVIVVEHTDGTIQSICYLDKTETQLRQERAKARQKRLKARVRKADKAKFNI